MKFIRGFLMTLGVIFLILIFVGVYLYFADPFELRKSDGGNTSSEKIDHPLLNETQEKALDDIGIDVSQIPSEITPEMEKCFTEMFGEARVAEIKNGGSPSAMELLKAKSCI